MKTDKTMTASELLQTMDARVWAQEFIRIFKDRKEDIDEGLMIGWFANAIMCGSDHMYWNMDEAMGKLKAENEELKIEKINLNNRIACMIDDIQHEREEKLDDPFEWIKIKNK